MEVVRRTILGHDAPAIRRHDRMQVGTGVAPDIDRNDRILALAAIDFDGLRGFVLLGAERSVARACVEGCRDQAARGNHDALHRRSFQCAPAAISARKSGSAILRPSCIADSCAQIPAQVQFTD